METMPNITKKTITITHSDFALSLMAKEINGGTSAEIIAMKSCTIPNTTKKHRITKLPIPFETIYKKSTASGMLKVIYANSVNRKVEASGVDFTEFERFQSAPLPYGEWVTYPDGQKSKILIEHKGELYVRITFNLGTPSSTVFTDENGTELDKDDLYIGYLDKARDERSYKISAMDPENSGIEVSLTVVVRTYKISSLTEMTMAGTVYNIVPDVK